jgi:hypothetical protein
MPDSNLTAAQKEAYAVARVNDPTLETIEISHSVAGRVFLVKDKQNLTATLETAEEVTFEAAPFRMDRPKQGESGAQEITLSIDNVDRRISEYLELVRDSQEETTVSFRTFLASDTSQPQMVEPITLTITDGTIRTLDVTISARFVDVLNRAFPNQTYNRQRFPSLGDS